MKVFKFVLKVGFSMLILSACSKPQQFTALESSPVIVEEDTSSEDSVPTLVPPTLVFVQFPNGPVSTNENTTIIYNVLPGSSALATIECKVNGVLVSCPLTGGTIVVANPVEQKHLLEIAVTDTNKLQASGSVVWQAFHRFHKVKLPLEITAADDQVDVLIVVDNSKSMKEEQQNMAERVTHFLDRLHGLDWRMSIVTTDMKNKKWGDGRLLVFPNGSSFISSKLSIDEAKNQFAKTIQRNEDGHHNEQAIKATFRAIERAMNPKETNDKNNKEFFRKNAALAVVVVSDEDESGSGVENTSHGLLELVHKSFGKEKIFKFHSIVVRPGDKQCLSASVDHKEAHVYAEFTQMTSGVLGNICAKDYGNQLTVIGQDVANTQNTFALTCVPMDFNNDGKIDVRVESEGSEVPEFTIVGDTIVFSKPPQKGKYNIEYFCPKK